jgi:hypothetical protein
MSIGLSNVASFPHVAFSLSIFFHEADVLARLQADPAAFIVYTQRDVAFDVQLPCLDGGDRLALLHLLGLPTALLIGIERGKRLLLAHADVLHSRAVAAAATAAQVIQRRSALPSGCSLLPHAAIVPCAGVPLAGLIVLAIVRQLLEFSFCFHSKARTTQEQGVQGPVGE